MSKIISKVIILLVNKMLRAAVQINALEVNVAHQELIMVIIIIALILIHFHIIIIMVKITIVLIIRQF